MVGGVRRHESRAGGFCLGAAASGAPAAPRDAIAGHARDGLVLAAGGALRGARHRLHCYCLPRLCRYRPGYNAHLTRLCSASAHSPLPPALYLLAEKLLWTSDACIRVPWCLCCAVRPEAQVRLLWAWVREYELRLRCGRRQASSEASCTGAPTSRLFAGRPRISPTASGTTPGGRTGCWRRGPGGRLAPSTAPPMLSSPCSRSGASSG